MHVVRVIAAILVGLLIALPSAPTIAAPAVTAIGEIEGTAGGALGEIHADAEGNLWVTDYSASEIWRINPTTNILTKYSGLSGGVVESQRGPNDTIWFNGYDNGSLGRLSLSNNQVITYSIPGAVHPWGLALDGDGNVWAIEHDIARIYRFNPTTAELCTFTLPNDSKSIYLYARDGDIWLGDYITDAMLRLDPTTNQITSWKLETNGFNSNPARLDADDAGNLWWADGGLGSLGRLEIAANRFTLFYPGEFSGLNYIDVQGDTVWYTDHVSNQFGAMMPEFAPRTTHTVTPTTVTLAAPTCANLGAGNASTATVNSRTIDALTETQFPDPAKRECNLIAQPMPQDGKAYDLAFANGRIWVTDWGRQRLIAANDIYSTRINSVCTYSYLPSVKNP